MRMAFKISHDVSALAMADELATAKAYIRERFSGVRDELIPKGGN